MLGRPLPAFADVESASFQHLDHVDNFISCNLYKYGHTIYLEHSFDTKVSGNRMLHVDCVFKWLFSKTKLRGHVVVCFGLHPINLKQSLNTFHTFPPSAVNRKFWEKSFSSCPSYLTIPSTTTRTVVCPGITWSDYQNTLFINIKLIMEFPMSIIFA